MAAKRRKPTITFQPDDEVAKKIERHLKRVGMKGKLARGERTRLLNQALRLSVEAASDVLERQLQLEKDALRRIQGESPS